MRRSSALLVLLMLLATLSGCGADKPDTAPPPGSLGTLNLALFQGGFGEAYWKRIVAEFESKKPGVKVNYMIHPKIGDLIRPALLSGDAPDFLYHSDTSSDGVVVSLIQNHQLTDLTDLFDEPSEDGAKLKDRFLPGILSTPGYSPYGDGRIYLAPFSYGPLGLMYNQALFDQHGFSVPATWDEFFALGDQAQALGISLITYPGLYPGYLESLVYPAIANGAGMDALERLFALDADVLSEPDVLDALNTVRRVASENHLLRGSYNMSHLQAQGEWLMDKALFIPNGIWIQNEMYGAPRTEGFTFALAAVPSSNANGKRYVQISYEQLSIPKNAKNPGLAKEFLMFLYSEDSMRIFAEQANGALPIQGALLKSMPLMDADVSRMFSVFESPDSVSYLNMFANAQIRSGMSINEMILSSFADNVLKRGMRAELWAPIIQEELKAYAHGMRTQSSASGMAH